MKFVSRILRESMMPDAKVTAQGFVAGLIGYALGEDVHQFLQLGGRSDGHLGKNLSPYALPPWRKNAILCILHDEAARERAVWSEKAAASALKSAIQGPAIAKAVTEYNLLLTLTHFLHS